MKFSTKSTDNTAHYDANLIVPLK